MKKSEVKISVTFRQVMDAGAWDDICEKYGINVWCVNEGRASGADELMISLEDAEQYGIMEKE